MEPLVFRSKVDGWLGAIVAAAVLAMLGGAWTTLSENEGVQGVLAALPGVIAAVLAVWVFFGTDYRLDVSELYVRSGPFRWRVPLREIRSVTPTRNPLASPALSLDRLRIDYGDGRWIMVSPADSERFQRELEGRRAAARGAALVVNRSI
jgi:hypothetical protein